jgi:VIT1/CCC1 family predicted Fe2+/Mn2+ transporter
LYSFWFYEYARTTFVIKNFRNHIETHFKTPRAVRDIVLGVADGLTVPFALAAGISGALDAPHIVIVAGLAEIAAGTISMGLGGYLSVKSEIDHYAREHEREREEVRTVPETEVAEVRGILQAYGLNEKESETIADSLRKRPQQWIDFMMRFELGLEHPIPKQALRSALTIGGAYAIGGLIPLSPYFFAESTRTALFISAILTLSALLLFGYVKGKYFGIRPLKNALQTTLIGGLAAATAFAVALLIA